MGRLQLQTVLENLDGGDLDPDKKIPVYFQPPPSQLMEYPCIKYDRDDSIVRHADNLPYLIKKRYQVIVITRDPDSLIPDKVEGLPLTKFDRFYIAAGLNHFVFNVFF